MGGKPRTKNRNNAQVVIAGAGSAGIAAAIAIARQGKEVLLLERKAQPGGTVTSALIHTIGGLYDSEGKICNQGLTQELVQRLIKASPLTQKRKMGKVWVLGVDPDVYARALTLWIKEEPKIHFLPKSRITKIECDIDTVQRIEFSSPSGRSIVEIEALIDATGCAALLCLLGENFWRESQSTVGGLIFQMLNVNSDLLKFPYNVEISRLLRQAAQDKILPDECAFTWIDFGLREGEAYVKLSVPLGKDWHQAKGWLALNGKAHHLRDLVITFLKKLPAFSRAQLGRTGIIGVREEGSIQGEYTLREIDVRSCQKFPDAACRCSWPIEYWDLKGGINLEYLPIGDYYEIPLRSLKVRGLKNVWGAGRCLSAEPLAQASSRIAGCCWSMGEAVGLAVANGERR